MIEVIKSESYTASFNLATEEYLLKTHPLKTCFYFWQNQNAIIMGKHQCLQNEVNIPYARENNIELARRLSGGGCVYHDMGNLNMSILMHKGTCEMFSWEDIMKGFIKVCEHFHIEAATNEKNDILVQGKKIIGTAERVYGDSILRHGCILVHSNLEKLEKTLIYNREKYEKRAIFSIRSRVENMNHFTENTIQVGEVRKVLMECFLSAYEWKWTSLSEKEKRQIKELEEKKYKTKEWILKE